MVLSKRIPRYLLTIAAVVLSVACMAMAVSEEGVGGGAVTREALSAPQHVHLVDSIRGAALVATKGDALAKEYVDELGEGRGVGGRRGGNEEEDELGEGVGGRRGAFLSTSGSFTLSSGGASRGGNEEEDEYEF